jgi:WD40 repeat protein
MEHKDDVWDFSFSPDGAKILIGYGRENASMWDFNNKVKQMDVQSCTKSNGNEALIHNTWSPKGDFYAVRWEKEVVIYHSKTDQVYTKLKLPWYPLYMEFSPDGKKMALGTKSDCFIADLDQQKIVHKLECTGFDNWATSVIYPEWIGSDTIIGRFESKVRVWKV